MCKDYPPFGSRQILSQNNAVAIHLLVKVSGDEEQGELIAHLRLMRRTSEMHSNASFATRLHGAPFTSHLYSYASGISKWGQWTNETRECWPGICDFPDLVFLSLLLEQ